MDQSSIRDLRRRLGWTQWDLAERVNVDQGTVSRWERGVESPRPATLAALRDLLVQDEHRHARKLSLARVRHSVMPAVLIDRNARLEALNDKAAEFYVRALKFDLAAQIGTEFDRHVDRLGQRSVWDLTVGTGIFSGDLLLARFYNNYNGVGHVVEYEPIFDEGKMFAVCAYISSVFDFPKNRNRGFERIQVVRMDQPEDLVDTFRGPLADFACANSGAPKPLDLSLWE